jgi:putative PIN family toxin of toxin-antitoxin system
LDRALRYPKLAAVFSDPERLLALLDAISEPVEPALRVSVLVDDADNRILEAAVAGQADVIITGDAELLALHEFEDVPVLTARELLDMIST